jgi:hypothetical protein
MAASFTLSPAGWEFLRRFEGAAPEADIANVEADLAQLALPALSQSQTDALISFVYSIGMPAFVRSDVAGRLVAGQFVAAADGFDAWRKTAAPDAAAALIRRRAAEKALFLADVAPVASTTARAEIDHAFSLVSAPRTGAAGVTLAPQPQPMAQPANDVTTTLKKIMAAEPGTAAALKPPPAPANDLDADEGFELIPAVREKRSAAAAKPMGADFGAVSLGTLGLVGALLLYFAGSAYAEGSDQGRFALLLFGAPGVMAVIMALYYLVRQKV